MARQVSFALLACAYLAACTKKPVDPNHPYLVADGIAVARISGQVPELPEAKEWAQATEKVVWLAAQRTVRLMDRDANEHRGAGPIPVAVRALASKTHVGIRMEWADATEDRAGLGETAVFGDSIAIEMPIKYGAGQRLPYIGMGDPDQHVLVSMMRATYANPEKEAGLRRGTYVGAGFGSLTRAQIEWLKMDMRYDASEKRWAATFVRPRTTEDHSVDRALVPFAIAVWDGHRKQRGGNKFLSRWKVLYDAARSHDPKYLQELSFGYNEGDIGDVAAGEELAGAVCAACHRFADRTTAPTHLAPELSNIGMISNYSYLRDSITKPSEIIVPVLNLNRHYSTSKPRDRYGAYRNDLAHEWFAEGEDGTRTSRMPSYASFEPEQIANILAYLKTLGVPQALTKGDVR